MPRRVPAGAVVRDARLILLLTAGLVWAVLFLARPFVHANGGLVGEYFANAEWNGQPAFSGVDSDPSTATMRGRWGNAPPERFSVRWAGFLTVTSAGSYTFTTASDDGSQLIVDNRVVVDNGGAHALTAQSGSIQLERGSHAIELRYVQFAAASALSWGWSSGGTAYSPVPAWALTQRRTSVLRVLLGRLFEWVFLIVSVVIPTVAAWFLVRVLEPAAAARWIAARAAQAVPAAFFVAIMFAPWAVGGPFFRSVEGTFRDLNRTAADSLNHLAAFRSNLSTPQAGEEALGSRVEEMLAMLRSHGVERYGVSASIAQDSWVYQQIIASGWPRKLENDAKTRFVLNVEPVGACSVVERRQEVTLVHCP